MPWCVPRRAAGGGRRPGSRYSRLAPGLQNPLLVRRGIREQATALATALQAATGAVTTPEIPVLIKPATRFRLRIIVPRRHGYRTLIRLQTAQHELTGDRPDTAREQIPRLRMQLRRHLAQAGLRIAGAAV